MAKLYHFPAQPTTMQDLPLAMLVNQLQDGDTYEDALKELKRRYIPPPLPRPTSNEKTSRRKQ
jgi:hypothetical protein